MYQGDIMKKSWLTGKTFLISGASGGIGFNVSKILIEKYDCKIIALARNEEHLISAKNLLGERGDNYEYKIFDVSVPEHWKTLAEEFTVNGTRVDGIINNAGFMLPFALFEKYSENEINEIVYTNFLSVVYSVKYLLPIIKQSATPAIINIASAAGNCAVVGESMYCATKFAVKGFTETLRQEYKKHVYVAGVYPGFIDTNILHRMSVNDKENKLIHKLMLPADKAAKKIVKGLRKKKSAIITGADGKSMSFFVRMLPKSTPSIVTKVLKSSNLDLFKEVFDEKENMQ